MKTSQENHNSKFDAGSLVTVMNIESIPIKNKELQLIKKTGRDRFGCDIWEALDLDDNRVLSVQTSLFNMTRKATQESL